MQTGEHAQSKLIRVLDGSIFDVAVDLRKDSETFGKWFGIHLSAENKKMLWVPPGFAHGFVVTSDVAEFLYKTTDYYAPEYQRCIRWDDKTLGIEWPNDHEYLLSDKDRNGDDFLNAEVFE